MLLSSETTSAEEPPSENVSSLFQCFTRSLTHLEEETYIWQALHPQGHPQAEIPLREDAIADTACVVRWPLDKFPLKIYVGPDTGYLFSPSEMKQLLQNVKTILMQFHSVNPSCFQFKLVPERQMANILLKFRKTEIPIHSTCFPEIGSEKQIKRVDITLNIPKSIVGNNFSHSKIMLDTLHAMLHALGVYGHSSNPFDATYKNWNPQQQLMTSRDSQTLQLLYRCPLGISKRDLMLLWEDYYQKHLLMPANSMLEAILFREEGLPQTATLVTPEKIKGELSRMEVSLQELFHNYLQQLKTA